MFKTILVPSDGSALAERAVDAAVKFAKETGAKIVGISVSEPHPHILLSDSDFFGNILDGLEGKARDVAKENVQKIAAIARMENVPCETLVAHSYQPFEEIINAAVNHNCDIIFMASHGRKGLSGLLLGSQTQRVLTNSTIPVLVFR